MESTTALCFGYHAAGDPANMAYHDDEWGRPIHDECKLLELICLEIFQVGLSWSTVLHKRLAFDEAFCGYDPDWMSRYNDADMELLLADTRLIRNEAKFLACITAAHAVAQMHQMGQSLADLIGLYRPKAYTRPKNAAARPKSTPDSVALSAALHNMGFRFIGPVNAYATMEACGIVNGHVLGCTVGDEIDAMVS